MRDIYYDDACNLKLNPSPELSTSSTMDLRCVIKDLVSYMANHDINNFTIKDIDPFPFFITFTIPEEDE